ncbi:VF530 family DNA-binding protein [Jejuia spongiicola]|uniref:VF530 family protein n=1 Tax=Jejuia spongiicola TaxID=2942207 RepID=A0ABT0QBF0_9FLAO|nr:VF530 family protein [Jejuia spongiicola]MCL6294290.1 VF530 family protein [Jejuia spongiicola]
MESQPNNPLHGVKLEQIINDLVAHYGWEYMGHTIKIKCFIDNPSVKSSLKFLRRTPWARTKVENMYLNMLKNRNRKS